MSPTKDLSGLKIPPPKKKKRGISLRISNYDLLEKLATERGEDPGTTGAVVLDSALEVLVSDETVEDAKPRAGRRKKSGD